MSEKFTPENNASTEIAVIVNNFHHEEFFKSFLESFYLGKSIIETLFNTLTGSKQYACHISGSRDDTNLIKEDLAVQQMLTDAMFYFKEMDNIFGTWLKNEVYVNNILPKYDSNNLLSTLIAKVLLADDEEGMIALFESKLKGLREADGFSFYTFLGEIRDRKIQLIKKISATGVSINDEHINTRNDIAEKIIKAIHDAEYNSIVKIHEYTSPLAYAEHSHFSNRVKQPIKDVYLEKYKKIFMDIENETSKIVTFMIFRRNKLVTQDSVAEFTPFRAQYCKEKGMGPPTSYEFDDTIETNA